MLDNHKTEAMALLAGIGIGAAAMYYLDPQRGMARRTQVKDQTGGKIRSARRDLEVTRRDLRNRARGAAAELRGRLRHEQIEDDQLEERVRAELGHHVSSSLRRVEINAQNGRVMLSGEIDADDHDEAIDAARHVRGVHDVEDHLVDIR